MNLISEEYLAHYGVKNMKWGKRKTKAVADPSEYIREASEKTVYNSTTEGTKAAYRRSWTAERRDLEKTKKGRKKIAKIRAKADSRRQKALSKARKKAYKASQKRVSRQQKRKKVSAIISTIRGEGE